MQTILVILIVAVASIYLINFVRKKLFSKSEKCEGCAISKATQGKVSQSSETP